MAIKTLQTRIALKYDSYLNWTSAPGKDLVLLKGEIGICEIPSGNTTATTAPTVLFKVGDGTNTFEKLRWASALAADVHGWAKASDVIVEGKTIKFVGGAVDEKGDPTDKVITLNFVTPDEVKAITDPLSERVADLEAALGVDGGSENSVSARLDTIEDAIDVINGEAAGSIKKAEVDAKAYADEIGDKKVDKVDGKSLVSDTEITKLTGVSEGANKVEASTINGSIKIDGVDTVVYTHPEKHAIDDVTGLQDALDSKLEAADISGKVDVSDYDTDKATFALKTDLTVYRTSADQDVIDNGIKGRIDVVEGILNDKTEGDVTTKGLVSRVEDLEAIDHDQLAKDASAAAVATVLDGAPEKFDTLKEIAAWIADADTAEDAASLVTRVSTLEAIDHDAYVDADTKLKSDIEDLIDAIDNHSHDNKDELDLIVGGDKAKWDQAVADLTTHTALDHDFAAADTALKNELTAEIDKKVTKVEGKSLIADSEIERLANVNNYNDTAVRGLISDNADDIAAINTTLNGTEDAVGLVNRVATIESDYLTMADLFIIDCGTSTTVVHENLL